MGFLLKKIERERDGETAVWRDINEKNLRFKIKNKNRNDEREGEGSDKTNGL